MISVTMDLMDMSELPVCAPDLTSLSSSPQAQATPVTSITDISTFPAQPQPTGKYTSSRIISFSTNDVYCIA